MLDEGTLPVLNAGRNLLAFSGGVDSTALFHLLLRSRIPFDLAHVNYHTREQSDAEAAYARALAARHGKTCFILDAAPIGRNFEAEARRARYDFFTALIREHGYANLLTAHQLDDRLEWLLMQLCKGAGLPELLGMRALSERDGYRLVRPLLGVGKGDLKAWLDRENIPFFEDASNADMRHLRNRFRHRFAAPLLEAYGPGIARSFAYLSDDAEALQAQEGAIDADVLMLEGLQKRLPLMRSVDAWLKRHGYVLRRGEKKRIQDENDLVIGRQYALSITPVCTLLTPLETGTVPRAFRERCRVLGIGPKVRPYLFKHPATFEAVTARLLP